MALAITWGSTDKFNISKVLNSDYSDVRLGTVMMVDAFIKKHKDRQNVDTIRESYLMVVKEILSIPTELIYFVRMVTLNRISLTFKQIPEFRHVVNFYMSLLSQTRREM